MNTVFDLLIKQAELFGISIITGNFSAYNPGKKIIMLGPDANGIEEVVLAHEIGHHMDLGCMGRKRAVADSCYRTIFEDFGFSRNKIILREKIAWENARRLLLLFGFTEWRKFKEERRKSINGYLTYKNKSVKQENG